MRWNSATRTRVVTSAAPKTPSDSACRSPLTATAGANGLPARGQGEPRVMASQVDGHTVSGLDCPVTLYAGMEEMIRTLEEILPSGGTIA